MILEVAGSATPTQRDLAERQPGRLRVSGDPRALVLGMWMTSAGDLHGLVRIGDRVLAPGSLTLVWPGQVGASRMRTVRAMGRRPPTSQRGPQPLTRRAGSLVPGWRTSAASHDAGLSIR